MSRRYCGRSLALLSILWLAVVGIGRAAEQVTASLPLRFMAASDVADQLRQPVAEFRLADGTLGQVKIPGGLTGVRAEVKRNELLITGTAEAVAWVQDLIKRLDVRPGIVRVKAQLVKYDREDDIPPSPPAVPGRLLVGEAGQEWLRKLPQRLHAKRAEVVSAPSVSTVLGSPAYIETGRVLPDMIPPRRTLPDSPSANGTVSAANRPLANIKPEPFGGALSVQCWRNADSTLQFAFVIKHDTPSEAKLNSPPVWFIDAKVAQGSVKLQNGQSVVVLFPIPEGESKRLAAVLSVTVE